MTRKDITDEQVLQSIVQAQGQKYGGKPVKFATDYLMESTEQPIKVCLAAMQRAMDNGLIDYGVSLRTAWLTEKGLELFTKCNV